MLRRLPWAVVYGKFPKSLLFHAMKGYSRYIFGVMSRSAAILEYFFRCLMTSGCVALKTNSQNGCNLIKFVDSSNGVQEAEPILAKGKYSTQM